MKFLKKCFYFMFVFLLVFVFAGCTKKKTEEKAKTEPTKATEPAKTGEKTDPAKTEVKPEPTVTVDPTGTGNPELGITFSINVYDIDGEKLGAVEVTKDKNFDGTVKGVLLTELCDSFDVVYTESDYGPYITSIAGSVVDSNYYVSILENGEYSMVGINDIVIDDGDVFDFAVVTWKEFDETDLLVDKLFYKFFKEQINESFPETGFSYPLLAAINKACHASSYGFAYYDTNVVNSNFDSKQAYIESYSGDFASEATVSPLLKAALVKSCYEFENDSIETALNGLDTEALNSLFYAPYYLMACKLNGTEPMQAVLDYYEDLLKYETPCDSVLLALQAYALYADKFENYEDTVNSTLANEASAVTENGFNDEWGGINCASTAQLIMTLVALNLNPRDYLDLDIVKALLGYEKDGSFLYTADAIEPDLSFSTPQAYAALIAYKMYRDLNTAINIYDVTEEVPAE